jgi:hypothetical protein
LIIYVINVHLNPLCTPKTIAVRKKKSLPRNNTSTRRPKPLLNWQTGEYQRHLTLQLVIPQQLLLLCKLTEVTPRELVADFMQILAGEILDRQNTNSAKEKLMDYFLEQRYGQDKFSRDQLIEIFHELNAITLLYPFGAENAFVDFHAQWREQYQAFWFNKWIQKVSRRIPTHSRG